MCEAFRSADSRTARGLYWDRAWSLVDGCSPVSDGCVNCWSAALAERFRGESNLIAPDRRGWSGIVRPRMDRLAISIHVRKPRVWSVWNDLLHPGVPFTFVAAALGVMACYPRHTFLVLTKRPERFDGLWQYLHGVTRSDIPDGARILSGCAGFAAGAAFELKDEKLRAAAETLSAAWPPKNVWLGTTVENQATADERVPWIVELACAGWNTWLSLEPVLGPVDLAPWLYEGSTAGGWAACGDPIDCDVAPAGLIRWAVIGEESGPGARPAPEGAVESLVDGLRDAAVPVFLKQARNDANGRLVRAPFSSLLNFPEAR